MSQQLIVLPKGKAWLLAVHQQALLLGPSRCVWPKEAQHMLLLLGLLLPPP